MHLLHSLHSVAIQTAMLSHGREADGIEYCTQLAVCTRCELIRERRMLGFMAKEIFCGPSEPTRVDLIRAIPAQHSSAALDLYLNWALHCAMRVTGATKGNVQIFDSASQVMHIVAQRGFSEQFLDFFHRVEAGEAACGKALETRSRVVIEDVTASRVFRGTPALEILLDEGVRAVQSSILFGSSGQVAGVLSVHWPAPHHVSDWELAPIDSLARYLGVWLEHRPEAP
jgi:hypothetical protein